jgi:hypothetical protein
MVEWHPVKVRVLGRFIEKGKSNYDAKRNGKFNQWRRY